MSSNRTLTPRLGAGVPDRSSRVIEGGLLARQSCPVPKPGINWRIRRMSYLSHAEKEFELAGWKDEGTDKSQGWVMDNIRELLAVLSKQGHSGSSAPYVLDLFNHLARFEIITPLTGKDEEWCNCP